MPDKITGRVCCKTLDGRGNVSVKTEYTLPDGFKSIGYTRYDFRSFSRAQVLLDVKKHCETLLLRAATLQRNSALLPVKIEDISVTCTSAQLLIKQPIYDTTGRISTPAVFETVTLE